MAQTNMSQTKLLLILGGILIAAIAILAGLLLLKSSNSARQKALENYAAELNKSLPKVIDKETRIDSVTAGPGNRLSQYYTLINREKGYADQDKDQERLRKILTQRYQKDDKMKQFRDLHVKFHYHYRDKNGQELFEIVVPQ